ncbi:ADP-ribose pyrophosphatase YjhB (NUDIX family) [Ancylobacter aquaticus]|uniref:ADP-ribose pyrophosphatase YjhB (NUDIX family) n=1 Tax=Ancylobacter aquaticus TaxID=100 RepID=A0A4R1HPS4_ANCAQ|nr:NUDIX hydrolase [Ancylobacter aquaticus]TCK23153.1 ADP-ribose pyrophosphatase YjhB (NUDIX family) [Ancylobacter aquaticus]
MSSPPPVRPIPAVLALVARGEEMLLVRRANPPDQGLWGFPGGRIEPGETYLDAALRELHEETGIAADAPRLLTVLDFIEHDGSGALAHHFAMIVVLCRWRSGEAVAADDALEARWFDRSAVADLGSRASLKVTYLADLALALPGEAS